MIRHIKSYFANHLHALSCSLEQFVRKPVASLMTIVMLGVAFSLPCSLWVILMNAKSVTQGWAHTTQMSLFLDRALSDSATKNTLKKVRTHRGVQFANFISPEQGLQTLEEQTGMVDVGRLLEKNPLPAVIEVHPETISKAKVQALFESLKAIDGVSFAKIDMQWLERLESMIKVAENLSAALQVLFGLAVILVVGNTIRLAVQNRQQEIEVLKLIGATNQFIRRPFLYFGFIYGLLGALLAWIVVNSVAIFVSRAAHELALLYHTDFHIQSLGLYDGLYLLGIGVCLGLLGARLAVSEQIKALGTK